MNLFRNQTMFSSIYGMERTVYRLLRSQFCGWQVQTRRDQVLPTIKKKTSQQREAANIWQVRHHSFFKEKKQIFFSPPPLVSVTEQIIAWVGWWRCGSTWLPFFYFLQEKIKKWRRLVSRGAGCHLKSNPPEGLACLTEAFPSSGWATSCGIE